MPLGALARDLAESLIQRGINRERLVVFIEQVRDPLSLVLRIERVAGS